MKYILIAFMILNFLSCHKSEPESIQEPVEKYFNPIDLPKLSIDSIDMPSGFFMSQERIALPDTVLNENVYQYWRRDSKTNKLVLLEESKSGIDTTFGASSDQIWYRNNSLGGNDKIEINKVICISDEGLLEVINYYTQQAFAGVFVLSGVPFAGEKSWVPLDVSPTDEYFTVMFCKHNLFIRLFVRISGENASESKQITEELAKRIVDGIDSFAVDKK